MKILLIFIFTILFSGCLYVNDRGISENYYNGCHEYYDSMGIYHKDCKKNIVEFKDVKNGIKKIYNETKKAVSN